MSEIIQGSPEWLALRAGKVTASRVADVIAKTKSGWGASRANYMAELIVERMTGTSVEGFKSPAMQWGTDMEPEARRAYEFRADVDVVQIGFVPHPTIAAAGASPDGLVGEVGLVEIKAPLTASHIETLLSQTIPAKYVTQMQWQLACCQREWVDFVSFDPRVPSHRSYWCKRIYRDDAMIALLEADVVTFLAELDAKVEALRALYEPRAAS